MANSDFVIVARLEGYSAFGEEPSAASPSTQFVFQYVARPLQVLKGPLGRRETIQVFMRQFRVFDEENEGIEPALVAPPPPGQTVLLYLSRAQPEDRALGDFVIDYARRCEG